MGNEQEFPIHRHCDRLQTYPGPQPAQRPSDGILTTAGPHRRCADDSNGFDAGFDDR